MDGKDLRRGRQIKHLTQQQAAVKLGVSQPYLSLMEKGLRVVPQNVARRAVTAFGLPATNLPLTSSLSQMPAKAGDRLAVDLASLGYPGFAHLKPRGKKNPAEVVLSALNSQRLDSRVVEALPWVLAKYPDLDWPSLLDAAKLRDLQNRLGLITSLARRVAEKWKDLRAVALLRKQEEDLSRSRLLLEDTLCNDSLTQTERSWLKTNRSDEAKFWRVLSDLSPEHLTHVD
jgi:transcriptional regulator with XRE-family HTH domain